MVRESFEITTIVTLYCCRERYGQDGAGSYQIHETEILDELKADDLGLNITVDDVGDYQKIGEDADQDDDGNEENLDVMRHQGDASRVTLWNKV